MCPLSRWSSWSSPSNRRALTDTFVVATSASAESDGLDSTHPLNSHLLRDLIRSEWRNFKQLMSHLDDWTNASSIVSYVVGKFRKDWMDSLAQLEAAMKEPEFLRNTLRTSSIRMHAALRPLRINMNSKSRHYFQPVLSWWRLLAPLGLGCALIC